MENNYIKHKLLHIILLSLLLLGIGAFLPYFAGNFNKISNVYAQGEEKSYIYEVNSTDTGYSATGYYTNNTSYVLLTNMQSLDQIVGKIELDAQNAVGAVEITFNEIDAGNVVLVFNQGTYVLKGQLYFANISANPCISVKGGAVVTLQNATIQNYASSAILNVEDQNTCLNITNTTISSVGTSMFVQNQAISTISNSIIQSKNSSAIDVRSATVNVLNESEITALSSAVGMIVYGAISQIDINSSTIKSTNGDYALENNNGAIAIYGNAKAVSKYNAIKTNLYITTLKDAQYFSGSLGVYYSGSIGVQDILIVKDHNQNATINLLNSGYVLREINQSLYIAKQYRVYYHSNCNDSISMPSNTNKYFNYDAVDIVYLDVNVRPHYQFVGYGLQANTSIQNAITSATLNISSKDLHLYAIWQPIIYGIAYSGINDGECTNVTTYSYATPTHINNPVRQYYTFTGWLINGETLVQNLTLPYGGYTNVELQAQFALTEFNINYINLTSDQVQTLGLQTHYNIQSSQLKLNEQNYLLHGYSFLGLYDKDHEQNISNASINFGVGDANVIDFSTGETLYIYVDIRAYYNGTGDGGEQNPFLIDNQAQFINFLIGEKIDSLDTTYIKLEQDIDLNQNISAYLTTLKNYNFDANGKTIKVGNLINYYNEFNDGVYAIFPSLQDVVIKNMIVDNYDMQSVLEVNFQDNLNISLFAYTVNACYLSNIQNNLKISATIASPSVSSVVQIAGYASYSTNSVFSSCSFNGRIKANAGSALSSAYVAGFLTSARGTMLVNCTNYGTIIYTTYTTNASCLVYLAGFAFLNKANLIVNSAFGGNMQMHCSDSDNIVYSGVAIVLDRNNKIQNCACVGEYYCNGQSNINSINCVVTTIAWSVYADVDIVNCVILQDTTPLIVAQEKIATEGAVECSEYNVKSNAYLSICNDGVSAASEAIKTFVSSNNNIIQECQNINAIVWTEDSPISENIKKIFVKIYNNINDDVVIYGFAYDSDRKIIVNAMYDEFLFEDFYLDDNYRTKFTTLDNLGEEINLYAKYYSYNEYTSKLCVLPILLAIIVIALVVLFMVYCEKPRKVAFIFDGAELQKDSFVWGRKIQLPKDKQNIMWFADAQGNKPLKSTKMKFVFGDYKIYTFNDDVRLPLEQAIKAKEEFIAKQKAEELRMKEQMKVQRQEQKIKDKQERAQKRKEQRELRAIEQQKLREEKEAKRAEQEKIKQQIKQNKQNEQNVSKQEKAVKAKQNKKSKLKQEIEASGVTIIKKEVRTEKQEKDL